MKRQRNASGDLAARGERPRLFPVRSRRDDGLNAVLCQFVANIVAVVALVAEEPVGIDVEAGAGKDALPLLAFTLERLYLERGGDGDLRPAEYEQLGRIRGSIEAYSA